VAAQTQQAADTQVRSVAERLAATEDEFRKYKACRLPVLAVVV
jgi:hypothetical protein